MILWRKYQFIVDYIFTKKQYVWAHRSLQSSSYHQVSGLHLHYVSPGSDRDPDSNTVRSDFFLESDNSPNNFVEYSFIDSSNEDWLRIANLLKYLSYTAIYCKKPQTLYFLKETQKGNGRFTKCWIYKRLKVYSVAGVSLSLYLNQVQKVYFLFENDKMMIVW